MIATLEKPKKRIYHNYQNLEEFHNQMWKKVTGYIRKIFVKNSMNLMKSVNDFQEAMTEVIDQWPASCEHNLTASNMNRIAWLGHAGCCLAVGSPEDCTREAWHHLSMDEQALANEAAARVIQLWELRYNKSKMRSIQKKGIGVNVYDACKQRIEWTFDNFEKISVSFSGGKDSTVMLHMVMDEAIKRKRKVGLLFIDLEGQYKLTIDHIQMCFDQYKDYIEPYWICLPLHLRNAVSVYETHWICWEEEKRNAWIREIPPIAISDLNYFPFFHKGMEFEEFVPEFGRWYGNGKPCACFVGIRSNESLNRFRTIASKTKETFNGVQWTTKVEDGVYNIYPIYDWKTEDLWIYHAKYPDRCYNHLYDYMHRAGLTIHQMRICQPYGDDQRKGLWLFHIVEPETWGKIVARVNGANQGAMYVKETGNIMGYRKINKPDGHTWKSFAKLLLKSMPPRNREQFENKVIIFIRWWMRKGYPDGIPDEAAQEMEAARKAPSWRRVCKSLLRNDYWCKGMGFTQHKSEAYKKYLELMKRRKAEWKMDSLESL